MYSIMILAYVQFYANLTGMYSIIHNHRDQTKALQITIKNVWHIIVLLYYYKYTDYIFNTEEKNIYYLSIAHTWRNHHF